jgi:hypothetical protein
MILPGDCCDLVMVKMPCETVLRHIEPFSAEYEAWSQEHLRCYATTRNMPQIRKQRKTDRRIMNYFHICQGCLLILLGHTLLVCAASREVIFGCPSEAFRL